MGGKSSGRPPSGGSRRKNPRILGSLVAQGRTAIETYFEGLSAEDAVKVFEESYAWGLVNVLLDLRKSTAKRLFEMVVRQKKRAFINVVTLYYYKEYLTNPLPLTLESDAGRNLPNHYAILGVPRDATLEELKMAHKCLEACFSPESFQPSERKLGEERLREVNAAFDILKNPKRRKALDDSLPSISYLYPRRDQSWLMTVSRLLS